MNSPGVIPIEEKREIRNKITLKINEYVTWNGVL